MRDADCGMRDAEPASRIPHPALKLELLLISVPFEHQHSPGPGSGRPGPAGRGAVVHDVTVWPRDRDLIAT